MGGRGSQGLVVCFSFFMDKHQKYGVPNTSSILCCLQCIFFFYSPIAFLFPYSYVLANVVSWLISLYTSYWFLYILGGYQILTKPLFLRKKSQYENYIKEYYLLLNFKSDKGFYLFYTDFSTSLMLNICLFTIR